MRATIIAVGSELLGWSRTDTNSLLLAECLAARGVGVARKVIVGDGLSDIEREVRRARSESTLVLMTGGLGPTQDDLTRSAVAAALGRELIRDPAIVEDIRAKFARFGLEMAPVNERQADVIAGALVLDNPRGTAPGLRLEDEGRTYFLFPGVPHELRGLVEWSLIPWLEEHGPGGGFERRVFRVACVGESDLEQRLAPFYDRFGNDGVSLLPSGGEVEVGLVVSGSVAERAAWLEEREIELERLLGESVFARDSGDSLEEVVGGLLTASGRTVSTAESCTGGGIAARLTAVPGSSAYFLGSAVTYSNEAKVSMLGISAGLIERHGAVSDEVAKAMAGGVCERLTTDYGLAVTGIAGPGGGSDEKPVGTVHIALASEGGRRIVSRPFQFPGDRSRVRRLTSQWALDLLRRQLLRDRASTPGDDSRERLERVE